MSEATGMGVDASGGPVIDPTQNVMSLVAAGNQRQDDLRAMEARHIRELAEVRTKCQMDEIKALQDVQDLRAAHVRELRTAEAERINAIREVDVQAVQRAAEVQATQATALASQVAASAEAMRAQVAAAASAAATALATALAPITTSIEQLRQAMYEAQGQKTQVVETRARSTNSGLWIGLAIAAATMLISVVLAVLTVVAFATHGFA